MTAQTIDELKTGREVQLEQSIKQLRINYEGQKKAYDKLAGKHSTVIQERNELRKQLDSLQEPSPQKKAIVLMGASMLVGFFGFIGVFCAYGWTVALTKFIGW